jgi:NAD(P)-dependent dehydrogenase (short-subunit alcohol dehydrogenase family)
MTNAAQLNVSDLHEKVAVVTGAGSGVGRCIALQLAGNGVSLVLCDIREESLKETARLIEDVTPVTLITLDISAENQVTEAFRTVERQYHGRLDIVVNCAAIFDVCDVQQIDGDRLDRMLNINLKGSFFMCREAIALMRKHRNRGSIVNIASTAGEYGSIRPAAHYAASKGGIIAMSKSLARECAEDGIRVNVVSPGPLDTPMSNLPDIHAKQLVGERMLLGRVGEPEDIGNAVIFLASSVSSWITGEVLRVNGGSLL